MNIHEYQGKALISKAGVPVPEGIVADTIKEAVKAARQIQLKTGANTWVIKAQIHAGGRGKGGGIKLANSIKEVKKKTKEILGMTLVTPQTGPEGIFVRKVLIQQDIYYPGKSPIMEFYISILLNRSTGRNVIIYSPEGGMDIEIVAEKTPSLIYKEEINPAVGIQPFMARKMAYDLGLKGGSVKKMLDFIRSLYAAYIDCDASLIEINPVVKTSDDKIYAVDAKVKIDDNALYRRPEIAEMRDPNEEDPIEIEAAKFKLNFIALDGNVGCMVNGAGLAMATMDIIKLSGGAPANFLDVGGSANPETVEAGFKIILKEPKVKAILINIFGGIVRCDRVALGIVEAYKKMGDIAVPVIVRLQGTNAEEAKKIIDDSGFKVFSAISLAESAELVKKVLLN